MKHYDYLLVGAGLFSATFANLAAKNGKKCLVIDKRSHIGGNIYTENENGINVHKYGAHIFHTSNERVWEYVNSFAAFNGFINSPKANYKGRLYSLPFNMNTFSEIWGVKTPEEAKRCIEADIKNASVKEPENLEEQAIGLVGTKIYEMLVKGYTEKQWGRDSRDLPSFIIKRLPLRFTFDNNYFNDTFQGIPIGGYTAMTEKMLSGCDVLLNCDYFKERARLSALADKIIFTGRADEYFGYSLGRLQYRSLEFKEETLNKPYFQECAVINYTEREVPFTRIIEHKYFENAKTDFTVITREYPKARSETGEPYYPVNDEQNNALYKKYELLAKNEKNVFFGGRLGLYKYLDMDKTVEAAFRLFEKIESE